MKQIITALCNENVNDKLNKYEEINVVMNDIQYQEGILEAIEINPKIEYVILSELLPGPFNIKELVNQIKKVKKEINIIIILEKEDEKLENFLLQKENVRVFYNNKIKIKEIAEIIINKNNNLEKEIQELKEIIFNKEENYLREKNELKKEEIKNKTNNVLKKYNEKNLQENLKQELITEEEIIKIQNEVENDFKNKLIKNKIANKFKKNKSKNKSKIILISGIRGVGKSVFSINIAKALEKQNNKILIIEFDFENYSIKSLLGLNKKENIHSKKINNTNNIEYQYEIKQNPALEDLIININKNIKLISNINTIFLENKIEENKLQIIIKELKTKYDFIIIDTSNNNTYLKSIIKECEKIIFLSEPNFIQIKKSQKELEKIIKELKIEKEKIYILFNKYKNDSIDENILKLIFKKYNILGKVNFIKNYNMLVNYNMKNIFIENKIKKQYIKIAKELMKNNNLKNYYLNKIKN